MRIDEWQAWLDKQFLDGEPEETTAAENAPGGVKPPAAPGAPAAPAPGDPAPAAAAPDPLPVSPAPAAAQDAPVPTAAPAPTVTGPALPTMPRPSLSSRLANPAGQPAPAPRPVQPSRTPAFAPPSIPVDVDDDAPKLADYLTFLSDGSKATPVAQSAWLEEAASEPEASAPEPLSAAPAGAWEDEDPEPEPIPEVAAAPEPEPVPEPEPEPVPLPEPEPEAQPQVAEPVRHVIVLPPLPPRVAAGPQAPIVVAGSESGAPPAAGRRASVGRPVPVEPAEPAMRAPRRRLRRPASAEPPPPVDAATLWSLVPRHIQSLISMGEDSVAQNSYSRAFKETRLELIQRLLDPTLSLEDAARILNVCPTTVRRYTNRGVLRHMRTAGDQRRFKLTDVLAFMESQNRAREE